MQVPQIPDNEAQRLDMLYALAILDTPPEERFDRITRLARFMFDVPIALLSLVDTSRQWFKSKQGVTQCETQRDISFCGHAILQNDIFEIPDATLDQRFANNPMVTAELGIRFYAGVPLIINDVAIGMLCIKDYKARCLTQEQKTAFKELAAILLAELVIDMQSRENHALRAKQQELLRFARVAEQSSSAVVITDTAGYVQWVNAEFSRMSGYPLAELINRKPGSVLQGPASDPHTIAQMRQALRKQQGFEVDIINYLPNGSPYWVHIKCNPIFDELGSLQGFMAIETDITSQKSFAEQLQQQLHALEILNDIATTSETDWAFQLEGALAKAAKYLKMELALINIIEGDKAIVHTLYPSDSNGVKKGQHFVLAETYCDITMQTGDIVVITQMSQSPYRVHSCFQHFALESFLGIPLLLADQQIGSLSFASALPRSEPFNTAELLFFRLFARWISSAMERQQVTQLVQYNEHRLRSLFELSPIGIALNDYQTGKFIDLNQALVNASGYQREELINIDYWLLTPAEYAPQEAEQLHLLNTTGRYGPYEKHYIRKDGSRYPVQLNGMLVTDQAGQKFIWSFVEDISERKQVERLQNEFIATVNHELRTPLTAIKGSLGLLLSGVIATLPEQVIELLHMANNNTSRLTALVNDLLDLEKILANKMPIELKACNLLNEVKEAILSIHSYAIKYGVTLKLVTELEQWVRVDPLRLQQVLANLLSNAVKFSPEGETVTIELTVLGNKVRVAVSDNGAGIPYAFRTRIFQKFAQADASDTRQKGGTGLGLAISKELIQRMAGSIDFISEEGKGTTFFIDLPCWHKEDVDVQ